MNLPNPKNVYRVNLFLCIVLIAIGLKIDNTQSMIELVLLSGILSSGLTRCILRSNHKNNMRFENELNNLREIRESLFKQEDSLNRFIVELRIIANRLRVVKKNISINTLVIDEDRLHNLQFALSGYIEVTNIIASYHSLYSKLSKKMSHKLKPLRNENEKKLVEILDDARYLMEKDVQFLLAVIDQIGDLELHYREHDLEAQDFSNQLFAIISSVNYANLVFENSYSQQSLKYNMSEYYNGMWR